MNYEAGNSVGLLWGFNSVCKQKDCSQSGRNAAVVAVEILDRNSRFTEKHSS